jgi:hypothetical protein
MTDVVKRLDMLVDYVGKAAADTMRDAANEIEELRSEMLAVRRRERGRCAVAIADMAFNVRKRPGGLPADPFDAAVIVLGEAMRAIDALHDEE